MKGATSILASQEPANPNSFLPGYIYLPELDGGENCYIKYLGLATFAVVGRLPKPEVGVTWDRHTK